MKHLRVAGWLAFLLLAAGCNNAPWLRQTPQAPSGPRASAGAPTAAELVAALNSNAQRVQALQSNDVDLDCTAEGRSVGLTALMVCQKPRNFLLRARALGNTAADLGSNDREFWFWISRNEPPYLYHCSYEDFARGVRMPLPFQPDWIVEALGIGEYDPAKAYRVVPNNAGADLVEETTSQGQAVRKITRFIRNRNYQWQVVGHILQDSRGQVICAASISEVQQDSATGVVLPRRVLMEWPAERLKMKMKVDHPVVNPALNPQQVAMMFTRPVMKDVPSYDLARGLDGPTGYVRPAGAAFNR
jgi:hypothetical protein